MYEREKITINILALILPIFAVCLSWITSSDLHRLWEGSAARLFLLGSQLIVAYGLSLALKTLAVFLLKIQAQEQSRNRVGLHGWTVVFGISVAIVTCLAGLLEGIRNWLPRLFMSD